MEPSLETRLAAVETRLSNIEEKLNRFFGGYAPPRTEPPRASASTESVRMSHASAVSPKLGVAPMPESRIPQANWLGIIAILCFVLAAGFIIKLSIDSGWLTPARQVSLSALLGLGLIGAGLMLSKSDREYASLLPGAGVIVLYLSAFAAYSYYGLIRFEVAIAMTSIVSAACIGLYLRLQHDIYAITAALGAYLAPSVLELNMSMNPEFSLYYFLVCSVAFAVISIWLKTRIVSIIAAYCAILLTGLLGLDVYHQQHALMASLLALHFAVFSVSTYFYTMRHRIPLTELEAWAFLPVLLIFYVLEYYFIARLNAALAPWISLGFAAFLLGLYIAAKRHFPEGLASQSLIMAFVTIIGVHAIYIELLPESWKPWLFPLIIFAGTFSPMLAKSDDSLSLPSFPKFALLAILAMEYISIAGHLLDQQSVSWIAVAFVSLASLWAAILTRGPARDMFGCGLLVAAHILAILGFYRLTSEVGSLAVSASWLIYGVVIILISFVRKDEVLAKSALYVLGFAAGKALLYDAASAPTVVRILCLLLTGVVLYGCGLFMRRLNDWPKERM